MSTRRCAEKGCDTVLSIYNPTDYCWQHKKTVLGGYRTSGSVKGCGTEAGYARHRRWHEPACHNCIDAHKRAEAGRIR